MNSTTIDPNKVKSTYLSKAKQSFKSRFDLLLYSRIREGNKSEITKPELEQFKIEDNEDSILQEYLNVYWQEEEDFEINDKKISEIYVEIKEWKDNNKPNIDELQKHYIKKIFPVTVYKKEDFKAFFEGDIECEYCHMTEDSISNLIEIGEIHKKHITRGWSLEIDRKKPNHEYSEDNCVWCCYWCNNGKTDEFTFKEFKKIGYVIESVWNDRLKK